MVVCPYPPPIAVPLGLVASPVEVIPLVVPIIPPLVPVNPAAEAPPGYDLLTPPVWTTGTPTVLATIGRP